MDKKPSVKRVYGSIAVAFAWLLFIALWLIFYATNLNIVQNIGVFLASVVVVGILEVIIWLPLAFKEY